MRPVSDSASHAASAIAIRSAKAEAKPQPRDETPPAEPRKVDTQSPRAQNEPAHADAKVAASHGGRAERLAERLARLESQNADGRFDRRVQRLENKLAELRTETTSHGKPPAAKQAHAAATELETQLRRAASLARKLPSHDGAAPAAENAGPSPPNETPAAEPATSANPPAAETSSTKPTSMDTTSAKPSRAESSSGATTSNGTGTPAPTTTPSTAGDGLKEAIQSGFSRLSQQLDSLSSQGKQLQQDYRKLTDLLADFQRLHERFDRMLSQLLDGSGRQGGGFLPLVGINVGLKLVRVGQSLFLGLEPTRFGAGDDQLLDIASRFARAASLVSQRNNAIQLAFGLHTSSDSAELVLSFGTTSRGTLTGAALDAWV